MSNLVGTGAEIQNQGMVNPKVDSLNLGFIGLGETHTHTYTKQFNSLHFHPFYGVEKSNMGFFPHFLGLPLIF